MGDGRDRDPSNIPGERAGKEPGDPAGEKVGGKRENGPPRMVAGVQGRD